jgi:hypothetical protein
LESNFKLQKLGKVKKNKIRLVLNNLAECGIKDEHLIEVNSKNWPYL